MTLPVVQVKNAKPKEKAYKLADEKEVFIHQTQRLKSVALEISISWQRENTFDRPLSRG